MIFTTSINNNYLPKARTMAQSVKKYYPESKFVLGLVERDPIDISAYPEFDAVVTPSRLWPDQHNQILYQYDVVEACTAIKGQLFCHIFKNYPYENKVIFLDPDIQVMSRMTELDHLLDQQDIILTPHLTESETTKVGLEYNEISVHRHGIFNLGFLALRRSEQALKLANWWDERLKHYCFADYYQGLFTDQKWMDQAPALFNTYVLKHPGYNAAPWNIGKRSLSFKNSEVVVNDCLPLRFFHFSGFDSGANIGMLSKFAPATDAIFKLRENYVKELTSNGEYAVRSKTWSYEITDSKRWIKKAKRALQREKFYQNPERQIDLIPALLLTWKLKAKRIYQILKN